MTFPVTGLVLEGAGWSDVDNTLTFPRDHRKALTLCQLCWTVRESSEDEVAESSSMAYSGVSVPVYLHAGRSELIVTVDLPVPAGVPAMVWRQRGVALLAWSPAV